LNPADPDLLEKPSLADDDWQLVQNFHNHPRRFNMDTCSCCHEKWFNMALNRRGICRRSPVANSAELKFRTARETDAL
jgi:hypothetical protein